MTPNPVLSSQSQFEEEVQVAAFVDHLDGANENDAHSFDFH